MAYGIYGGDKGKFNLLSPSLQGYEWLPARSRKPVWWYSQLFNSSCICAASSTDFLKSGENDFL